MRERDHLPHGTWRLILHPATRGSWNMAVDEAIARMAATGRVPPTLRFYMWEPACISLGRHQPLAEIDQERCRADGVDVVRRPTGGRAILHVDELTYSVAGPSDEPRLRGAILDCYLRLSEALTRGLELLGLHVHKADAHARAGRDVSAACFEVPSAYEILTVDGRKIVGSAQVRKRDWVLQHGAIPLWGDVTRLVNYLALEESKRAALRTALAARAVTVSACLQRRVTFEEVADALAEGFAEVLNITLMPDTLTREEIALAKELERDIYATEAWTARV